MNTKKILLIPMLIYLGFNTKDHSEAFKPLTSKTVNIAVHELSDLELLQSINPPQRFSINIIWIKDAAYNGFGSSEYLEVRNQIRYYYERAHHKEPFHIILNNNEEIWHFDCPEDSRNSVEGSINSEPNIKLSDDDD